MQPMHSLETVEVCGLQGMQDNGSMSHKEQIMHHKQEGFFRQKDKTTAQSLMLL